MTADNRQRVSLNAFRGIMGGIVQILMGAVTMPMIMKFGQGSTSDGRGYFLTAVIFSILSIPCFLICVAFTKMNAVINFGPAIMFLMAAVLFALNEMTNELGRENEEKLKEKMVE